MPHTAYDTQGIAMLAIRELSYTAGQTTLLFDISLVAQAGKITVLLGPNGAGKTTLIKSIMGLYKNPIATDYKNRIIFNDELINSLSISARVTRGLSYLSQQSSLFIDFSVEDNLHLVYQYHEYWQGKKQSIFLEEMNHWLESTSLLNRIKQPAGTLSGGQKRKLEVVRTLLMHPKMILLDEPFAGVDPKSIYELKNMFSQVAKSGIGIVLSDHHVDQLFSIADTVFVVIAGKVITSGSIHDILQDEQTKNSYLGNQFYDEMVSKFSHNKEF